MKKILKRFFPNLSYKEEKPKLYIHVNKYSKNKKEKEITIMRVINDLERLMLIDK